MSPVRALPLVLLVACAHGAPFQPTAASRRPCDGSARCARIAAVVPPSIGLGDQGLAALQALSGEAFDVAWLSQMLAQHETTLHLARRALTLDRDPAARAAAAQIIEDDGREAAELRSTLEQRYHRGPGKYVA